MDEGFANRVRLGLVFFFLFFMLKVNAAEIRVTEATKQSWASGISYQHGVLYNIGLLIYPSSSPITLDSMWLEGNGRSLINYNYKGRRKNDTISVWITDEIFYDAKIRIDSHWDIDPNKKGIIISYFKNKKKFLLDVTPYIKELYPVAYP